MNLLTLASIAQPRRFSVAIGAGAGSALVEWDAVSGAAGYKVYWGQTEGGPYSQLEGSGEDVGDVLEYNVTGLSAGTWYFKVTSYADAFSEIGLEFVDEVSKVVT